MPWLKSDDKMPRNDKVWELTDAEYRLMDAGRHFCAEKLTDGWIPSSRISSLTPKPPARKQIDALVKAKLWHRLPEICIACVAQRQMHRTGPLPKAGYLVHDYLHYNPSKTEHDEDQVERHRIATLGGQARAKGAPREGGRFASRQTSLPLVESTSRSQQAAGAAGPFSPAGSPAPYPVTRSPSDLSDQVPTLRRGGNLRPIGDVAIELVRDASEKLA